MKNIIYLLITLLLSSCATGKKEPAWVHQSPTDGAYYNSVVRINKKAPNYVDLARDNALKDISTQISVVIDANVALTEGEVNGVPSAEIVNQIRTSSRNKLANVQLAGSFQTDKDYWAYYRLSKSEYFSWRQAQSNLAIQQAIPLLQEFDEATSNIASGITALLKAMELTIDFADMDLSTIYKGQRINLYNELLARLNRLPENLKLQYSVNEISVVAKQRDRLIIPVSVAYKSFYCKSFPLIFNFRGGAGDIVTKTFTDSDAKADLIIRRITDFGDPQFIEMKTDKDYWFSRIENPVVKHMLELLQFPAVTLKLNVSRPKAFIDYSFDNTPGSSYRDILAKKLQDLDLEVVADSTKSDYIFKVIVVSKDGDYVSRLNLFSASADAYVDLRQRKGYKSLYSTYITGVKSTGSSRETALKMSELNAITEICDKLLYMLVEQHIMQ